jgi:uncharacterized protein (DUF3820 family)
MYEMLTKSIIDLETHCLLWLNRSKFKPEGDVAAAVNMIADSCIEMKATLAKRELKRLNKILRKQEALNVDAHTNK